jgi:hypothetical protein
MKPFHILVIAALLPLSVAAQEAAPLVATEPSAIDGPTVTETGGDTEAVEKPFGPVSAAEVVFADLLYVKRPIVVFADSPNDPNFVRQMELIGRNLSALEERDVIVLTDTDPAARSEVRLKLRPRGFSLVILDKDLNPVIRKPLPWDVREITAVIDKMPLRRQEVLERNPAGR